MSERGMAVLDQYNFEVFRISRVRGAMLVDTSEGLKLMAECSRTENRIGIEQQVLSELRKAGFPAEQYVANREGGWLSKDEYQKPHVLKDWFEGRECSARDERDCLEAVVILAKLHLALQQIGVTVEPVYNPGEVWHKHNREMGRVRKFLRNRNGKTLFERNVLETVNEYLAQGQRAAELWERSEAKPTGQLCHGNYTYHHVLLGTADFAVTGFSSLHTGYRAEDLYYFMRKVLEKNHWSLRLGAKMLETYNRIFPMGQGDWNLLYLLFLYPEKYWKQLNYYYNTRKNWISDRNRDKIDMLEQQKGGRDSFLDFLLKRTEFA
ncbi:MAG: phosphotransferase [Lachnospiraceae bacterium]|nr:phosphotransferase [Lachnospiraceae bacterium]